jgi:hypothetical protein
MSACKSNGFGVEEDAGPRLFSKKTLGQMKKAMLNRFELLI